jgi:hypothetical protein
LLSRHRHRRRNKESGKRRVASFAVAVVDKELDLVVSMYECKQLMGGFTPAPFRFPGG